MFASDYESKFVMSEQSPVIPTAVPSLNEAAHDAPATDCPRMAGLPVSALTYVATHFQALADPTRLRILEQLRLGERNVGELAQVVGCTSANISRHLSVLMQQGFVERECRGTSAYYRIADQSVYELCDLVCGAITRQLERNVQTTVAFGRSAAER